MFILNWQWSVFLGETGATFVNRLKKKVPSINNYTDAQITQATDLVGQLKKCQPMNKNELDPKLINSICNKIKQSRELEARQVIEKAASPEARSWCIDALKAAVTMICTCGPTVVKEATFNLLECD